MQEKTWPHNHILFGYEQTYHNHNDIIIFSSYSMVRFSSNQFIKHVNMIPIKNIFSIKILNLYNITANDNIVYSHLQIKCV